MSAAAADQAVMARALVLAERGRPTVRPNPLVGCVLVRDGEIVGEGYHARAGGAHAEVAALAAADGRAGDATAYVTLEPCDHVGRTGPCSRALLDAGVRRVVYAAADPHPDASGGAARLRGAGVDVDAGLLAAWAEEQNRVFLHAVRTGRPFVTLKLARTADGGLTAPDGRWITGPAARTRVHQMRAASDAVLVGAGTVLADDPRLDVRHVDAPGGQPRPVVLDGRGRTPVEAAVVREGAIVITTASAADRPWARRLTDRGVDVVPVAAAADGGVDLGAALTALADRGIQAVLAEPGATLAGALVRARLVDRFVTHRAPPTPASIGAVDAAAQAATDPITGGRWRTVSRGPVGNDVEIVQLPEPAAGGGDA